MPVHQRIRKTIQLQELVSIDSLPNACNHPRTNYAINKRSVERFYSTCLSSFLRRLVRLRRGHDGEIRPLLLYCNSAEELPLQGTGFTEAGVTGFYITELESITAGNSSLLCSCCDEGSSPALSFMCHDPALSRHAVGYGNQGYLLGVTDQDVFHPVSRVPHACHSLRPSTRNAR